MGIAERKERQKKEVRDSILQAAWKLVNEEGWQSLSIRKIADAIEYSVPVVYDHFENKEAILFEFSREGFSKLYSRLNEVKDKYSDPVKRLEGLAYAYWDFAFEHKEYYQVMYGLGMPNCEQVKKVPDIMGFTGIIKDTIEQIMAQAGVQDGNSFFKLNSFWSMLHGLVSINLVAPKLEHHGMSSQEVNRMILNDFLDGFVKGLKA